MFVDPALPSIYKEFPITHILPPHAPTLRVFTVVGESSDMGRRSSSRADFGRLNNTRDPESSVLEPGALHGNSVNKFLNFRLST